MTDQGRRSSRSVCANLSEAWRKRRYEAAFISKLSDSETEAAETQVWIEFAHRCGYIDQPDFAELDTVYEGIIASLVHMMNHVDDWVIRPRE